ncbi:MAG: hypothetical protein K2W95_28425 [Candidatus Obscuribacterales bacterium]|nr:hypothetical protein [Candidatus Obscuribacterales bacterium]
MLNIKMVLGTALLVLCQADAIAKSPLEAAQDLATTGEGDPGGFTLMIVSISLLFVFAISLIVAASLHVFKKKPTRTTASPSAKETTRA